jgi:hypothetical protein
VSGLRGEVFGAGDACSSVKVSEEEGCEVIEGAYGFIAEHWRAFAYCLVGLWALTALASFVELVNSCYRELVAIRIAAESSAESLKEVERATRNMDEREWMKAAK